MAAPVVNDYKKPFILRRLAETFLGGLKIGLYSSMPMNVHLLQVALWSLIPTCMGVFLFLLSIKSLKLLEASLACGCFIGIYVFTLQFLSMLIQKHCSLKEESNELQVFGDEDVYVFDSPFGPRTCKFLIPQRKNGFSLVINSTVAGIVAGLSIGYLSPVYKLHVPLPHSVLLSFCIIGTLTVTFGIWPLIVGSPPEPAFFQQLPLDLNSLSRSSHLLTCIGINVVASLKPTLVWFFYINCLAHVVFALCSFLWILGTLPPIDAYFLWVFEQWLVMFLGGSPTASNTRLIIQCSVSTASLLAIALIKDFSIFAIAVALSGYVLSLDYERIVHCIKRKSKVSSIPVSIAKASYVEDPQAVIKESLLLSILLLGVLGLSAGVHLPNQNWYKDSTYYSVSLHDDNSSDMPHIFQTLTVNTLWMLTVAISTSMIVMQTLLRPYFSIFKNPLFFVVKNNQLLGESVPFTNQLIRLGGPFVSLLFIHVLIGRSASQSFGVTSYLHSVIRTISYSFIMRRVWQFPEQNLVILSIYYGLEELLRDWLRSVGWFTFLVPLRMQLITLFLLSLHGSFKRLRTVFALTYTSIAEPKQRKIINYFILGWNIATLPLLVVVAFISSMLSCPLLPLFTLPFFLVGFPRPLRFWPTPVGYSANVCSDSIYYEQFQRYVLKGFHNSVLSGKLGIVQPGEMFLLRWEDRFFWIQVLECGFVYFIYSLKGLELQETSCHTVEASRVDSVFSSAFTPEATFGCFNHFPLHCLTPQTKITALGYCDTRNVLTGVLDSPETLKVISEYFQKTLIYILLDDIFKRSETLPDSLPFSPSIHSESGRANETESAAPLNDGVGPSSGLNNSPAKSCGSAGRESRMAWVNDSGVIAGLTEMNVRSQTLPPISVVEEHCMKRHFKVADDGQKLFSSANRNKKLVVKSLPTVPSKARSYVHSESRTSTTEWSTSDSESSSSSSDSEKNREMEIPNENANKPESATLLSKSNKNRFNKDISIKPVYRTFLSTLFAPPDSWIVDPPYPADLLEDLQDTFPLTWFKFLLKHFGLMKLKQHPIYHSENFVLQKEHLLEGLLQDECLEEGYRTLVALCHTVIIGSEHNVQTPNQVLRIFSGEIPISNGSEWLKKRDHLLTIILKAYRIAVKLSLDHAVMGPSNNSLVDLYAALHEYLNDWYIGPDQELKVSEKLTWNEAVRMEIPSLFALGYNDVKGVYTSHLLKLGLADINVGSLDRETVRAIWASLVAELLYFANDDDERYSIQAHPVILRNLTIQAADPPLGYPIFNSPPAIMGFGWFRAE